MPPRWHTWRILKQSQFSSASSQGSAPTPPVSREALEAGYQPSQGHFDELRGFVAAGDAKQGFDRGLCAPWADFFKATALASGAELDQRLASLQRQIRDNGVTYNVYSEQEGPQRPWSLDLFPLIIDASSWAHIEAGVHQRMRLLEALMQDAYGPQTFMQQGLLPAALVHGHPGFLRSMQGVQPAGGVHLHVAAFDLARGPDGLWWLVAQRTQAPSGLGYLMENRLAVSAQFPQAFANLRVRRLADTYKAFMDSMRKHCPEPEQAHIALLTPGPYNETYFEHAYLARYLGLTLVEGSDLVVRDARLYLKTLRGLERVHGLLKRVDDEYLDPLELRPDSTLGVPGLMQAVRAGNVMLANAPGSAFLESPALLGFLPKLAEQALGEELVLPAVPTWWCGEASVLESELPHLTRHTIKATYPGSSWHPAFDSAMGYRMDAAARTQWAERIRQRPDEFTLQAYMPVSHMPTWHSGDAGESHMRARAALLRVFAVSDGLDATGKPAWRVLPGGMARVAGPQVDIASMQRGGSSADVWALRESQATVITATPPNRPLQPTPQTQPTLPTSQSQSQSQSQTATNTVLAAVAATSPATARKRLVTSRAAENLYWLGRYTERAENTTRLARVMLQSLGAAEQVPPALMAWLVQAAVSNSLVGFDISANAKAAKPAELERALIRHLGGPNTYGVAFSLAALRRAASAVRERLSQEHWSLIERAEEAFDQGLHDSSIAAESSPAAALRLLRDCSDNLAAITGGQTDRMTRDDGWRLLSIGRHVERLSFLALALEQGFSTASVQTPEGFDAMLALFDSTITFRAQFQQSRELEALTDLLVRDSDNPRSLAWVTHTLRGRLAKLAGSPDGVLAPLSLKLTAPSDWEFSLPGKTSAELIQPVMLPELLQTLRQTVLGLSNDIGATYFTHSVASELI